MRRESFHIVARRSLAAALAIAFAITASHGWAQATRFSFEAEITFFHDEFGVFEGVLDANSILMGSFVVDLTVPDEEVGAGDGTYILPGGANDLSITSGGFSAFPTGLIQVANVANDFFNSSAGEYQDRFSVAYDIDTVPSAIGTPDIDFVEAHFVFEDSFANALSSDSLAEAATAIPFLWERITIEIFGEDDFGTVNPFVVRADVTSLATTPLPLADFDHDGVVGAGDLSAWSAGFGGPDAAHVHGDADNDDDVDGADFLRWQRLLGDDISSQVSGAAVPEPSSAALLGWLAVFCRRRRC